jgi:hypothetical protein
MLRASAPQPPLVPQCLRTSSGSTLRPMTLMPHTASTISLPAFSLFAGLDAMVDSPWLHVAIRERRSIVAFGVCKFLFVTVVFLLIHFSLVCFDEIVQNVRGDLLLREYQPRATCMLWYLTLVVDKMLMELTRSSPTCGTQCASALPLIYQHWDGFVGHASSGPAAGPTPCVRNYSCP